MKHTITLNEMNDFFGLNIVGNIWDNVSTSLNKICNQGLVVCFIFLKYLERT